MKRYLPHLLALAGLVSCVPPGSQLPAGELGRQFTATVPGTWHTEMRVGNSIVTNEKTFRRDGTAKGTTSMKNRGYGVSVVMPATPFTSKWRIEGDNYYSYDVKSPDPTAFTPGKVFHDRIVSVSQNRIVCRNLDLDQDFTMTRVR
jgi:hypothetical protein